MSEYEWLLGRKGEATFTGVNPVFTYVQCMDAYPPVYGRVQHSHVDRPGVELKANIESNFRECYLTLVAFEGVSTFGRCHLP